MNIMISIKILRRIAVQAAILMALLSTTTYAQVIDKNAELRAKELV